MRQWLLFSLLRFLLLCPFLAYSVHATNDANRLFLVHQKDATIDQLFYYIDYSNQLTLNTVHNNKTLLNFQLNPSGQLRLGFLSHTLWIYLPMSYLPKNHRIGEQLFFQFLPGQNIKAYTLYYFHHSHLLEEPEAVAANASGDMTFYEPGLYHVYIKVERDSLANVNLNLSELPLPNLTETYELNPATVIYGIFIALILQQFIACLIRAERRIPLIILVITVCAFLNVLNSAGTFGTATIQYHLLLEQIYALAFLLLVMIVYQARNNWRIFYILLVMTAASGVLAMLFSSTVQYTVLQTGTALLMALIVLFLLNRAYSRSASLRSLQYYLLPCFYLTDYITGLTDASMALKASLLGQGVYLAQSLLLVYMSEIKERKKLAKKIKEDFLWRETLLDQVNQLANETHLLIGGNFEHRHALPKFPEIRQLAYNLNTLANVLEHSQRSRQRWIADISHELRTPLTILKGEMEAIQDGIRPMDSNAIDSFYQEICRITKLVQDLHELSLSDKAELIINRQAVDVQALITQQLKIYEPTLNTHEIRVVQHFDDRPETLNIDPDRFIQLVVNLIKNTIKYTDSPGQLSITTYRRGDQWVMRWEDSAPTVPEDMLGQLFNRLFRGERSRNSKQGGSGLGLSLCKSIVSAHDGKIYAKQSKLGGLNIEVVLPISIAEAS